MKKFFVSIVRPTVRQIIALTGLSLFAEVALIDTAFAQDQAQHNSPQPRGNPTREQLLFYLANEKVVVPGVGFVNARIGDPMSAILNAWGEPSDRRESRLLGKLEFLYQPDPDTSVAFHGKERLKTISIRGNSASLMRTRSGARFGFSSLNIRRMFSRQKNLVKSNRIEYPQLGISFYLSADNRVNRMVVYAPKSS